MQDLELKVSVGYTVVVSAVSGFMLQDWFGFHLWVGFVWFALVLYAGHVGGKMYDWMCNIDRKKIAESHSDIGFISGKIEDLNEKVKDRSLSDAERNSTLSNLRNLKFQHKELSKEYEVLTHNVIG